MIAVIESGSKQFLVKKDQKLKIDLVDGKTKKLEFKPLLLIDDDKVQIGKPYIEKALVEAKITEPLIKDKKVVVLKYKPKKRYKKKTGHRQRYSEIVITNIKS